jgi:hypothetical protein
MPSDSETSRVSRWNLPVGLVLPGTIVKVPRPGAVMSRIVGPWSGKILGIWCRPARPASRDGDSAPHSLVQ